MVKKEMKYDKGSFMWAVQEMKKGNNVRRKSWKTKDIYCYASGETIFYWDYEEASLEVFEIEATDWEVYIKIKYDKEQLCEKMGQIIQLYDDLDISEKQLKEDFDSNFDNFYRD